MEGSSHGGGGGGEGGGDVSASVEQRPVKDDDGASSVASCAVGVDVGVSGLSADVSEGGAASEEGEGAGGVDCSGTTAAASADVTAATADTATATTDVTATVAAATDVVAASVVDAAASAAAAASVSVTPPPPKLTPSGRPACASNGCFKSSQGRRCNFMCVSHYKSSRGEVVQPRPGGGSSYHRDHTCSGEVKEGGGGQGRGGRDGKDDGKGEDKDGNDDDDWVCDHCGLTVPGTKSRCKCHRWRNGVHAMCRKKGNKMMHKSPDDPAATTTTTRYGRTSKRIKSTPTLYSPPTEEKRRRRGNGGGGTKVATKTASADDDDDVTAAASDDDTDWKCDQCGRIVPGSKSRCQCYRWRGGVHPMTKLKGKGKGKGRKRTLGNGSSAASGTASSSSSKQQIQSMAAASPRKRAKPSVQSRRDARRNEAAMEAKAKEENEEDGYDTNAFQATMLRAVNEAPNDYAAALAAAAFEAAGGDEWLKQEQMRLQESRRRLGLLPDAGSANVGMGSTKKGERSDAATIITETMEAMVAAIEDRNTVLSTDSSPKREPVSAVAAIISETMEAMVAAIEDKSSHEVETPMMPKGNDDAIEDPNWEWNEAKQMKYRPVLRISVHNSLAKHIVTEARMSGTPVVLTGHVGWAGFASRWLRRREDQDEGEARLRSDGEEEEKKVEGDDDMRGSSVANSADKKDELLDLSDPSLYLDVDAMADDIGQEEVPVVKKGYDDTEPILARIPLRTFLDASWPSVDNKGDSKSASVSPSARQNHHPSLYLHQWQFPLSETGEAKLCRQSKALPNRIFGEDLYKYWLDRCPGDCPLQYLFMGNEETMSKMHKDPGGLAISIAPIVGEKECVLVHRDDGNACLYHLEATVDPDSIDFDAYPLLSYARVWRTTIKPGEILIMPQGTYHQCRNVTPCLSYSRFHLDTINLRPFLQSMFDGDAAELSQDEVIWNAVDALMKKVDKVTDAGQEIVKKSLRAGTSLILSPDQMKVSEDVTSAVDALRSLRHIVRETARKLDLREAVKGSKADRMPGPSSHTAKIDGSKEQVWSVMVEDIDYCLHEFRYRFSKNVPKLPNRRARGKKRFAMSAPLMRAKRDDAANITVYNGYQRIENDDEGDPILSFSTNLERGYTLLSRAPPGLTESDRKDLDADISSLSVGDEITVQVQKKMCQASVLEARKCYAAYLSYEDYPALYDEFLPCDLLRDARENKSDVPLDQLKPGKVVIGLVGEKRDEYRGIVQSVKCCTLYKTELNWRGDKIERWVDSKSIIAVGGRKKRTNVNTGKDED